MGMHASLSQLLSSMAQLISLLATDETDMAETAAQVVRPAQVIGTSSAACAVTATEISMRAHDGLSKQRGVKGDRSVGAASCWSTVTQVCLRRDHTMLHHATAFPVQSQKTVPCLQGPCHSIKGPPRF